MLYLLGSVVGFIPLLVLLGWREWRKPDCQIYQDRSVDISIWAFVLFDVGILLLLVCQQGGLCRSMFIPVFFLIPTAYMAVERKSKMWRVLILILIVMGCIVFSFYISKITEPANVIVEARRSTLTSRVVSIPTTDFQALAHSDYDLAMLWASLISAAIPGVQTLIIMHGTRQARRRTAAEAKA